MISWIYLGRISKGTAKKFLENAFELLALRKVQISFSFHFFVSLMFLFEMIRIVSQRIYLLLESLKAKHSIKLMLKWPMAMSMHHLWPSMIFRTSSTPMIWKKHLAFWLVYFSFFSIFQDFTSFSTLVKVSFDFFLLSSHFSFLKRSKWPCDHRHQCRTRWCRENGCPVWRPQSSQSRRDRISRILWIISSMILFRPNPHEFRK